MKFCDSVCEEVYKEILQGVHEDNEFSKLALILRSAIEMALDMEKLTAVLEVSSCWIPHHTHSYVLSNDTDIMLISTNDKKQYILKLVEMDQ